MITSFAAREVMVSTLGVIYSVGEADELDVVLEAAVRIDHREVLYVCEGRSPVLRSHLPERLEFLQTGPRGVTPIFCTRQTDRKIAFSRGY